jgi:hypothetical protein
VVSSKVRQITTINQDYNKIKGGDGGGGSNGDDFIIRCTWCGKEE